MFKTHEGKVAVVTGAARSMGQAICRGFAERGAAVVGIDRLDMAETGEQVASAGADWLAVTADLTSPDQIGAAAAAVSKQHGSAEIIVNCAGILPSMSWDELDYETWQRVLRVNLDSQFLMCKAFVPLLRTRGRGRIINFTSGINQTPSPKFTAYRTSKMAITGFTRSLASDLGEENITVNAVSPSFVVTKGNIEAGNDWQQDFITQAQSIKRPATSEDIVGLVCFLGSDEAAFITGQTMHADGGLAPR